jgi:hypothetical protein
MAIVKGIKLRHYAKTFPQWMHPLFGFAPTYAGREALPHEARLPIIHYSFFIIHYALCPVLFTF